MPPPKKIARVAQEHGTTVREPREQSNTTGTGYCRSGGFANAMKIK
jgi:hypothetical protein